MKTRKHRLNLELSSESMKCLLRLKKATDAASMTEVIRNALRVYEATHGTPPTKTP